MTDDNREGIAKLQAELAELRKIREVEVRAWGDEYNATRTGSYTDHLHAKIDRLNDEVKRLSEVVDSLPKTMDGVPITPGMTVWFLHGYPDTSVRETQTMALSGALYDAENPCYSSREAAEQAVEIVHAEVVATPVETRRSRLNPERPKQ